MKNHKSSVQKLKDKSYSILTSSNQNNGSSSVVVG